jgi:MFS family permease
MRALLDRRFRHISIAGIFFQGGAAAVDTSTIIAALVHTLTAGSAFAVGTAAAISRFGWLFPQLFVAYYAQQRTSRLPFYMAGAFGRVACLVALGGVVWMAVQPAGPPTIALFFVIWTVYAFVSGIVAVPYNDIVARSIPSHQRSRMLALRFFGGGLLALAVAALAQRMLAALPLSDAYAAVLLMGAGLLFISAVSFVTAREPAAPSAARFDTSFADFLRTGMRVLRNDRCFRLFLAAQWLGGVVALALPFYVLLANVSAAEVAVLLGAQTGGALFSNPFWGWWGDRLGKRSLLEINAGLGAIAPLLALVWIAGLEDGRGLALPYFAVVFSLLGAVGNGGTIAQLGYLMEISPDDHRPAYSGYFNAAVAPVTLLPMAAGAVAQAVDSFVAIFAISGAAAALQFLAVRRLRSAAPNETTDADTASAQTPQAHR